MKEKYKKQQTQTQKIPKKERKNKRTNKQKGAKRTEAVVKG